MDSILEKGVKAGLYLLLLTPFIVTDTLFFPYITGKNIFVQLLIPVIALGWVVLSFSREEVRPRRSWLLAGFSVFVLVMLLAAAFGVNPMRSIFSNFERMEGWITLANLLLLFLTAGSLFTSKQAWNRYLSASVVVSVIVVLFALPDIGETSRIFGTFGNPTYLAVYAMLHVFIAGYLAFSYIADHNLLYREAVRKPYVWMYWVAGVINAIGLYFTATRSAFLGLIAGAGVALVVVALFERDRQVFRKIAIAKLLVLVLLGGIFFIARDSDFVQESRLLSRFANISLEDDTTRSRFILWGVGLESVKERPLLGWGQENFLYAFSENYDPDMFDQEPWFDRAHNVFFDWLTQGGILGFLAYMSLFVVAVYLLFRRTNLSVAEKSLVLGLLVAYVVNNFFVFDNITSYLVFATILAFIHSESVRARESEVLSSTSLYGVLALILVIGMASWYSSLQATRQGGELIQAVQSVQTGNAEASYNHFENALSLGGPGKQEVAEHLSITVNQMTLSPNVPGELKNEFALLAEGALNTEDFGTQSYNPRSYNMLGTFYLYQGDFEAAATVFEKGLEYSPNRQILLAGYASTLEALERPEDALRVLEHLYNVAPQFDQSKVIYAIGLLKHNQTEEALALLEAVEDTRELDRRDLVTELGNAGLYDQLVEIFEDRVSRNPDDTEARYALAVSVYRSGERGKALQMLQQIKSRDDDETERVDTLMQQMLGGEEVEL